MSGRSAGEAGPRPGVVDACQLPLLAFGLPKPVPAQDETVLGERCVRTAVLEPGETAGRLMKQLMEVTSLTSWGMNHMKRIRRVRESGAGRREGQLEIILCPTEEEIGGRLPDAIAALLEAAGVTAEALREARVPRWAPSTREQGREWSKLWPVNFRAEAGRIEGQGEDPVGPEPASTFLRRAAALAGFDPVRPDAASSACVIVDPATGEVVGEAGDGSASHVLHHAVMRAVAEVAARDVRLWPDAAMDRPPDSLLTSTREASVTSASVDSGADVPFGPAKRLRTDPAGPVGSAGTGDGVVGVCSDGSEPGCGGAGGDGGLPGAGAMAAVAVRMANGAAAESADVDARRSANDEAGCRDGGGRGLGGEGGGGTVTRDADAPQVQAPRAKRKGSGRQANRGGKPYIPEKPYLCTGFDAYVWREPCAMCAMGLLHSRVRRVFYCVPDESHGALHGPDRLHGLKGINHRYRVFHVPLAPGSDVQSS